jgi:hypothetical protein
MKHTKTESNGDFEVQTIVENQEFNAVMDLINHLSARFNLCTSDREQHPSNKGAYTLPLTRSALQITIISNEMTCVLPSDQAESNAESFTR